MTSEPAISGDSPGSVLGHGVVAQPMTVAPSNAPADQMTALSHELENLRDRLREVDYRASVMSVLVGADDQSHIAEAAADLEAALADFRSVANNVVSSAESTAARFGVRADERTLAVLAERAPEQFRDQLRRQTDALVAETQLLRNNLSSDVGLVNSGERHIAAALQLLLGDDDNVTYEPASESQARVVDQLA